MQEQATERGPRGKYSPLICHGCRARKIKCMLPSLDGLGPLGVPQPRETSCERCRNRGLECIVERTSLGRPAAKRGIRKHKAPARSVSSTSPATPSSTISEPRDAPSLLDTDIKSHLFGDLAFGTSIFDRDTLPEEPTQPTNKKTIFRSIVDPLYFFSSILAKDKNFGVNVPRLSTDFDISLPGLVSSELAQALDNFLTWHRFFLPHVPTIAGLRNLLVSDDEDDNNSAAALLFSLLCLTALEITEDASWKHPHLKRDIQLAISYYGQEFLFSPPIHPISVSAALFLAEYQPTAVATSQQVVHRTVKSEAYIKLAYRIAEQLEMLPTQCSLDLDYYATGDSEFEDSFFSFLQGLQVYCYDASLGGFVMKPVRVAREIVDCLKPHIEDCQRLLSQCRCSPTMIYHIRNITGTYMQMKATVDLKENWSRPANNIYTILDQFEKDCLDQRRINNAVLTDTSLYAPQGEISAASLILEMQFQSLFVTICGLGLTYSSCLRARAQNGSTRDDPELDCDEAIQLASQVIQCIRDGEESQLSTVMQRFGVLYTSYVQTALTIFIENTGKLKLGGMPFRPPPRFLMVEVVRQCKLLVENNVLQVKCFGRLNPRFEDHFRMFEESARLLEGMKLSPWRSVDAAFADGCLYAASGKVVQGFIRLMHSFKSLTSDGLRVPEQNRPLDVPSDFNISQELESDFWFQEWALLWPSIGEGNDVGIYQGYEVFSGTFAPSTGMFPANP